MTDKQTGGPAFPCEVIGIDEHGEYRKPFEGMTLRDYFAAKAMQAFMTVWMTQAKYPETDLEVAEHAYLMADAMLKAREQ